MATKQQKIISILEELKIGITPRDAKYHLEFLSDAEIANLLYKLEKLAEYQASVAQLAARANPEEAVKITESFEDQLLAIEQKFAEASEKQRAVLDEGLNEVERKYTQDVQEVAAKSESNLRELEEEAEEAYSVLTS